MMRKDMLNLLQIKTLIIPSVLTWLMFFISSCSEPKDEQVYKPDPEWSQDQSSDMNQVFAAEENDEIELYVKRHEDWNVTKTGTGLRYFIYQKSELNDTAHVGDLVTVDFEISLLDGTICYSSSENGPESFIVEKADIESGLHEAMQLMCTGDRAKFILPSHMAHGLIGDEEKIPPLSPVVYDIQLLKIERP
ncbi:MAG: FKBP-type peptidyl-prolyl cis-trans isomerase [Crocinitomicaceae bacterium]|nr:FKBP-type peptidyl-prolyl cis-trans isomerase [Crocinitomicaceae bacterium]